MFIASIAFFLSLALVVLLFGLKHWEVARGRIVMPNVRASADHRARALKAHLGTWLVELQKLPSYLAYLSRFLVHEAALGFAQIARMLEAQAHNVADLVSHKRSFEKRSGGVGETRSEFLKKMSDRTSGSSLDTQDDNGHNA